MPFSHDMSFPANLGDLRAYVDEQIGQASRFNLVLGGPNPTGLQMALTYWLPLLGLANLIPYSLATKLFVAGPLLLAALVSYEYFVVGFNSKPIWSLAAALFVGFNPWIFEHLVSGHIFILASYPLMVAATLQTALWIERPTNRRLIIQGLLVTLTLIQQPHYFLILFGLSVIVLIWRTSSFRAGLAVCAYIVGVTSLSCWLLYNHFLYYSSSLYFPPEQQLLSTSRSATLSNVVLTMGSWLDSYFVATHGVWLNLIALFAVALILGWVGTQANLRYLIVAEILFVALAMGARAPYFFSTINLWAVGHVPVLKAFREPNKFEFMLVVVLAIAIAHLSAAEIRWRRTFALAATSVILLGVRPFLTPFFFDALRPTTVPNYYAAALDRLDRLPPAGVLVLPMTPELSFTWGATPARPTIFYHVGPQSLILDDFFAPGFSAHILEDLDASLQRGEIPLIPAELDSLGVQYALIMMDTEPAWLWRSELTTLLRSTAFHILFRDHEILVLERDSKNSNPIYASLPSASFDSLSGLMREKIALSNPGSRTVPIEGRLDPLSDNYVNGARVGALTPFDVFDPHVPQAKYIPVQTSIEDNVGALDALQQGEQPPLIALRTVRQSVLPLVIAKPGTTMGHYPRGTVWEAKDGEMALTLFVAGPFEDDIYVRIPAGVEVGLPSQVDVILNNSVHVAQEVITGTGSLAFPLHLHPGMNLLTFTAQPTQGAPTTWLRVSQEFIISGAPRTRLGHLEIANAVSVASQAGLTLIPRRGLSGRWRSVNVPCLADPKIVIDRLGNGDSPYTLMFQIDGGETPGLYFWPILGSDHVEIDLPEAAERILDRYHQSSQSVVDGNVTGLGILVEPDSEVTLQSLRLSVITGSFAISPRGRVAAIDAPNAIRFQRLSTGLFAATFDSTFKLQLPPTVGTTVHFVDSTGRLSSGIMVRYGANYSSIVNDGIYQRIPTGHLLDTDASRTLVGTVLLRAPGHERGKISFAIAHRHSAVIVYDPNSPAGYPNALTSQASAILSSSGPTALDTSSELRMALDLSSIYSSVNDEKTIAVGILANPAIPQPLSIMVSADQGPQKFGSKWSDSGIAIYGRPPAPSKIVGWAQFNPRTQALEVVGSGFVALPYRSVPGLQLCLRETCRPPDSMADGFAAVWPVDSGTYHLRFLFPNVRRTLAVAQLAFLALYVALLIWLSIRTRLANN